MQNSQIYHLPPTMVNAVMACTVYKGAETVLRKEVFGY